MRPTKNAIFKTRLLLGITCVLRFSSNLHHYYALHLYSDLFKCQRKINVQASTSVSLKRTLYLSSLLKVEESFFWKIHTKVAGVIIGNFILNIETEPQTRPWLCAST